MAPGRQGACSRVYRWKLPDDVDRMALMLHCGRVFANASRIGLDVRGISIVDGFGTLQATVSAKSHWHTVGVARRFATGVIRAIGSMLPEPEVWWVGHDQRRMALMVAETPSQPTIPTSSMRARIS